MLAVFVLSHKAAVPCDIFSTTGEFVPIAEDYPQSGGIFNRLTCALTLVWKHGMSCISEEACRTILPTVVRLMNEEPPGFDICRVLEIASSSRSRV